MESAHRQSIVDAIQKSRDIVIVSSKDLTYDTVGSALSLYLGLTSLGKTVTVVSPSPMIVEFSSFVGADKLTHQLKKRNFLISLDYQDGSIEKVSYNIEGNKFNLVIEPRPGFEGFSEKNVTYGHSGSIGDTTILLDIVDAASIETLFSSQELEHLTQSKSTIAIGHSETTLGGVQYIDTTASTNVEVVYSLLTALGVAINEDIASNILSALYMTTDNFRMPGITADTFSVASACMAAHGKRFPFETTGAARVKDVLPSVAQPVSHTVSSSLANSPVSLEPTFGTRKSAPQEHTITTSETQNSDLASVPAPSAAPQPAHQTPEDWLKPKIFKSSETGTQH